MLGEPSEVGRTCPAICRGQGHRPPPVVSISRNGGPANLGELELGEFARGNRRTWPRAMTGEKLCEITGDLLRGLSLDHASFDHGHQLAVLQQHQRGRRRRVSDMQRPDALDGVVLHTGEDCDEAIRDNGVLEGQRHTGPCTARSAAADRVDQDEQGSRRFTDDFVDVLGCRRSSNPTATSSSRIGCTASRSYVGCR